MKRCASFLAVLLLLYGCLPGAAEAATARAGSALDSCTALLRSSTGNTTVQICPPVVPSGQPVYFVIHSLHDQMVTALLRYPSGGVDRQSAMTDSQGALTLSMTVRYNPLYRYAQVPFVISIGDGKAETVSGSIRVAQMNNVPQARIRVRPAASMFWCGPDHCVIRDNTTVVIRVETAPSAEVQISLMYPNGESVPCPGNDLGGSTFADATGAFVCRLPVYYDLGGSKAQVTVLVDVSVTAGTYSIPLQYKLWLRAK